MVMQTAVLEFSHSFPIHCRKNDQIRKRIRNPGEVLNQSVVFCEVLGLRKIVVIMISELLFIQIAQEGGV
jgi:hypothetical protein